MFTISFGPAHPAAHGVFRLLIEVEEEIIFTSDACLGLLFRSSESLAESKTIELMAGYFARLDYVSHLILEYGFCFGSIEYSPQLNKFCNSTLVANHLLNLSCTLADAVWCLRFYGLLRSLSGLSDTLLASVAGSRISRQRLSGNLLLG